MTIFLKKSKPKDAGSQNEPQHENETVLFGDDLSSLKTVDDDEEGTSTPEASNEGLQVVNAKKDPPKDASVVIAEDGCCHQQAKPCVSRVIDSEGSAKITIILGRNERANWLGQVVGLIDSASEKDVVDITVCADDYGASGTTEHRSLLSAIDRCKASVITRAGILTTIGDVAIWLAGKDIRWSKTSSCIFVKQPVFGYAGDGADFEEKATAAKRDWEEFRDYIVARGLFTIEEMNTLYSSRGVLGLFGAELNKRMSKLKQVA